MKILLTIGAIAVGLFCCGCSTTCNCNCPYCCGGDKTNYNDTENKPISDMPIWWKETK